MYTIEKNIPIAVTKVRYPFADLQVGESFFVPGSTARKLSNAAQWYKSKGMKFTCKTMGGGARCWRVE